MGIAWDYLEPIQRAQLLKLRPDLKPENHGGRPRLETLSELRQQSSLDVQDNNNGGNRLPNGLRELKEMYRLKIKGVGGD